MKRPSPWLRAAGLALLASAAGGCAALGWTIAQSHRPKVPAVYEPPPRKVVLVLVDDLQHPVSYTPMKYELTQRLNELLETHKVAADTVPYDYLQRYRFATDRFNSLSVVEIGRGVGADLVLHVEITDFSLRDYEMTDLWHGRLDGRLQWVDTEAGRKLWPRDRAMHPLGEIDLPKETDRSPSYAETVARKLADKAAGRIARLFYEHEQPLEPPRTDWSQYEDG